MSKRHWLLDPAGILEREDNRRACPACRHNDFTRSKMGVKQWYCRRQHNQRDGTQTAESCPDYLRKGIP